MRSHESRFPLPYIQIQRISKTYGKQRVLSDVSASFERGRIHGLIGRNGSGKTQLFKVICGYVVPDSGEVFVGGKQIGKDLQYPASFGLLIDGMGFLPRYSGLFNLQSLAALNTRLGKKDMLHLLDKVGLSEAAYKKVGKYSLGMRQRLGIAQALIGSPEFLLLDEPFIGLDKSGVKDIHILLKSLREQGTTILLASHNPYDIETLCDTVHEMDAGRINRQA